MMYRRKPLTIEAMQYIPDTLVDLAKLTEFIGDGYLRMKFKDGTYPTLIIKEKDAAMEVQPGEYVVKTDKGVYAVSKDAFEKVYEPIKENETADEPEEMKEDEA